MTDDRRAAAFAEIRADLAALEAKQRESERAWLRADIAACERFLRDLPADHYGERLGFEAKRRENIARLRELGEEWPST
jgi:hypothetical protein